MSAPTWLSDGKPIESNTIASANTAVGYQALHSFTTGPVGFEQLGSCTAVGFQALANATGGFANSAFGYQALISNTIGTQNTATGVQALQSNTMGNNNTAHGTAALSGNTAGSNNTAVGVSALAHANTNGNGNIALGAFAGSQLTTGNSNNIDIGNIGNIGGESDTIRIGDSQTSTFIAGINGATAFGGAAVFIDGNNHLGTITSSKRFKEEIKPMDKASEALFALKPVTFRYKKQIDPKGTSQFGLVAEDVEVVNPDLVARDKEGKPYTVRYDQVNAMLLNEFLKEHRKVEEQQATIAELKSTVAQQQKSFQSQLAKQEKQMEALTSGLQKVSAQVEVNRPRPQVVVNDR
jgi:uncharacterized coiled-coil protein SlyX